MLLLVLVGCGQTDADGDCVNDGFPKSGYVCGSEEDDTISEDNPIADVTWTSDAIELTITGGLGYNFEFGLVQIDDDNKRESVSRMWASMAAHGFSGWTARVSQPGRIHAGCKISKRGADDG